MPSDAIRRRPWLGVRRLGRLLAAVPFLAPGCGAGRGAGPLGARDGSGESIWDRYRPLAPRAMADRNLIAEGWSNDGCRLGELLRAGLGEARTGRLSGRYAQRLVRRGDSARPTPAGIRQRLCDLEPGRQYTWQVAYRLLRGGAFVAQVAQAGRVIASGSFPCGDRQWKRAGLTFRPDASSVDVRILLTDAPVELLVDEARVSSAVRGDAGEKLANPGFERFRIEGPRPLRAARADGPMTIDGLATEDVWQMAPVGRLTDDFGYPGDCAVETSFRVAWDSDRLFVFIICMEPSMPTLRRDATLRDADCQQDDHVEIVVVPDGQRGACYRLALTAGGTLADSRTAPSSQGGGGADGREVLLNDKSFDPEVRHRVRRKADRWEVELSVPLADLGVPLTAAGPTTSAGRPWGLNVCRLRRADGKLERFAWSPTGGQFGRTSRLGLVSFDGPGGAEGKESAVAPGD